MKIWQRTAHCRSDVIQQNCSLIRHLSQNNTLYTTQLSTVKLYILLFPEPNLSTILYILYLHLCLKTLINFFFFLLDFQTTSSHVFLKTYLYISYGRVPCTVHTVLFTVLCSRITLGFISLVINTFFTMISFVVNTFFTMQYPKLLKHVLQDTET